MKFSLYTLFAFIFLFSLNSDAQNIDLQGFGGIDCNDNLFHFTIQARNADAGQKEIGSFSVYLDYNTQAIDFNNFNSLNFDGSDNCNSGQTAWSTPVHDAHADGKLNMTFILDEGAESSSCPSLDNQWVDIAELTFNIYEFPDVSDIGFNLNYTHFNSNLPNDGTADLNKTITTVDINNCLGDFDNDGVSDETDNCPTQANPDQADINTNGIGDICEPGCDLIAYTGSDQYSCPNESVLLAANGLGGTPPYTYSWSDGSTTDIIMVTAAGTTEYVVTVTDALNCVDTDTVGLFVNDAEILQLVIYDLDNNAIFDIIQEGDSYDIMNLPANYNIRADYSGFIETVSFDLNGTVTKAHTEYSAPYHFLGDATPAYLPVGSYNMIANAWDGNGQVGLNCSTVNLNFTITTTCPVDLGEQERVICLGSSTTLTAAHASGGGTFSYQWSNNTFGPSTTIVPTVAETYSVTVTDGSGCSSIDYIHVIPYDGVLENFAFYDYDLAALAQPIVDGGEYFFSDLPENFGIEAIAGGTHSSVSMIVTGATEYTDNDTYIPYRYRSDSAPLTTLQPGTYTFTVTVKSGNYDEGYSCEEHVFTFKLLADCPSASLGVDATACLGEEIILLANEGAEHSSYSYTWSTGEGTPSISVNPTETTTYAVTVTGNNGCQKTDDITMIPFDGEVTDLAIWDIGTASIHTVLTEGMVLSQGDLPASYNIIALTGGTLESVGFTIEGGLYDIHTDNSSNYQMPGTTAPLYLASADYTLSADAYLYDSRGGTACGTKTVNFTLVDACYDPSILIWMEGPYDAVTGEMKNDLYQKEVLPGMTFTDPNTIGQETPAGQPYGIAPWMYGTESYDYSGLEGEGYINADYPTDIVDWVLVSFRRIAEDESSTFLRVAALLHQNGSISFPANCLLSNANVVGDTWVVVEHRNHMGIMSEVAATNDGTTLSYNFQLQDSWRDVAQTGVGQKEISPGVWVMYAGDGSQIGDIVSFDLNGSDKNVWSSGNGAFNQYTDSDFDLNGDVNGADKSLWNDNNGFSSRVPR